MPMEQNLPNREIIDATQDAVLNAAGSVANVLENTAHEISGHGEAFYLSPEFGSAFLLWLPSSGWRNRLAKLFTGC